MRITLTGSLGHIGKPLTTQLVAAGHTVTVVSSSAERADEITALGAIPAIGTLQDVEFLSQAFTGAEVVYTMVPPANYFDQKLDLLGYYKTLGRNYAEAIRRAGVQRVVIQQRGVMGSNLDAQNTNVWVSSTDIAAAVADELVSTQPGRRVRYVASDERTYREVATALGQAIGKPDLQWTMIPDEQFYQNLAGAGMQPSIASLQQYHKFRGLAGPGPAQLRRPVLPPAVHHARAGAPRDPGPPGGLAYRIFLSRPIGTGRCTHRGRPLRRPAPHAQLPE